MAPKHLKPPDLDLELNRISLTFKDGLHNPSIGNGDSVEMMLNGGGGRSGSFGGGGGGGSMRESYSYHMGNSGDDGEGRGSRSLSMMRRHHNNGKVRRWADSFRRDPSGRVTPKNAFVGSEQGRNYFDLRAANYRTAHPLLAKELKGRHLQMIAIGGSIGECLWVWRLAAFWW